MVISRKFKENKMMTVIIYGLCAFEVNINYGIYVILIAVVTPLTISVQFS